VQSSPRGSGSRTLRVHHLREAARLPGSGVHRMQILADSEPPKFRSESCPAREGASPKGARPCPQLTRGEGCVTLAFPYDTNCMRIRVQGSCALWAGAMRYVDELRIDRVLRSSERVNLRETRLAEVPSSLHRTGLCAVRCIAAAGRHTQRLMVASGRCAYT
jgi:hypothetical protein